MQGSAEGVWNGHGHRWDQGYVCGARLHSHVFWLALLLSHPPPPAPCTSLSPLTCLVPCLSLLLAGQLNVSFCLHPAPRITLTSLFCPVSCLLHSGMRLACTFAFRLTFISPFPRLPLLGLPHLQPDVLLISLSCPASCLHSRVCLAWPHCPPGSPLSQGRGRGAALCKRDKRQRKAQICSHQGSGQIWGSGFRWRLGSGFRWWLGSGASRGAGS